MDQEKETTGGKDETSGISSSSPREIVFEEFDVDLGGFTENQQNKAPEEQDAVKIQRSETPNKTESWSFLNSKIFWITIVALYLIWLGYDMGKSNNTKLTPQEMRENINLCNNWGGRVIYDDNNQYYDCEIR